MRIWIYLGVAACLAGVGAVLHGAMPSSHGAGVFQSANPEDVKVADGIFVSDYFDLSYRLPEGWTEGLAGPDPSQSGYYVGRTPRSPATTYSEPGLRNATSPQRFWLLRRICSSRQSRRMT